MHETFERLHTEGERAIGENLAARGWVIRAEPAAEARGFWAAILGVALEGATRGGSYDRASAEAAVDLVLNLYLDPDRTDLVVTRVLVAAGSGLRRAAMIRLLEDAGFEVTGQAGDAGDLLRKARAHRPDVAIAELPTRSVRSTSTCRRCARSAASSGSGCCSSRKRSRRGTRPRCSSWEPRGPATCSKGASPASHRFIEAVRDVAACGSVLDTEVVTRLMARERRNPVFDELSERDREVLAQMAAGVTNRGIARRMFLSERAIERHVTSIFDALGIAAARQANRRVLAVLAYLRGGEPA